MGQMEAYINKAAKFGGKALQTGLKEFKPSFEALRNEKTLSKKETWVSELLDAYDKAATKKESLATLVEKHQGKEKELCAEAQADLLQVSAEDQPVGKVLVRLAENKYSFNNDASRRYWARTLCEAATEVEDASGLLSILKTPELSSAHTSARKALRVIDFINFGPAIG